MMTSEQYLNLIASKILEATIIFHESALPSCDSSSSEFYAKRLSKLDPETKKIYIESAKQVIKLIPYEDLT